MLQSQKCPSCGSEGMTIFFENKEVPVHSVLLLSTREEAQNYPCGDIILGFCQSCGFISNIAFEPSLHDYSSNYEATQGFSSTFNRFHKNLAERLIEQYELYDKDIIEIGCGQGEFLTLLCQLGGNRGIGFDPAYVEGRVENGDNSRTTVIKDFYSEKYTDYHGDFVCCKMTLEHIHNTAEFVSTVRRSIGNCSDTIVFFQVPDIRRILRELAFWDIYYEHCSYFSSGSIARLFRRCGFDVIDLSTDYDDQYLMIEARPGDGSSQMLDQENDLEDLRRDVAYFAENYRQKLEQWQDDLQEVRQDDGKMVIWGAGSKGVAFLTALDIHKEIEYAVDINPHKHGTYMAGTGQEIVAPAFLQKYQPDVVIVMNPIYYSEIKQELDRLGVAARLLPV